MDRNDLQASIFLSESIVASYRQLSFASLRADGRFREMMLQRPYVLLHSLSARLADAEASDCSQLYEQPFFPAANVP
ncbi:MAG: hypothetical protein BGO93_01360 [Mesorhizobium sp. 65-26]|nr:MAG: hypothetical protein ABS57_21385 [Mesorhizobium sp. SCN 65-12]OJX75853.1 MAG: hypothetical protein BGO93_01360 [Mesorhizobium sp. 65-26]